MNQNINNNYNEKQQERKLSIIDRIKQMEDEVKRKPDLADEISIVKIEYYLIYTSLIVLAFGIIVFIILYFQNIANVSRSGSPDSGDVAGWGVIIFPIVLGFVSIGLIPDYLNRIFFNKYISSKNNNWLIYTIISSLLGCIIISTKFVRQLLSRYYIIGLIVYLVFKIATIIYSSLILIKSQNNN